MNILEHEIESILVRLLRNHPDRVLEKGLDISKIGWVGSQINLGNYGVLDVINVYLNGKSDDGINNLVFDVFELKKDLIDIQTLLQSVRYCRAIKSILQKSYFHYNVDFRIHLIGRKVVKSNDFIYMTDIFNGFFLYEYKLDAFDGISFEKKEGYKLKDENLPNNVSRNIIRQILNSKFTF